MEPSLQKRVLQSLERLDQANLSELHVVMLPDFFVDHFVYFDTVDTTCDKMHAIATQGGGNLPGVTQRIQQGGNAANTVLGLARLGMCSHLICRTDTFGLHLLQYFLGKNGVDLSGVSTEGSLAMTTAFEFQNPRANIMIGDPGSVASFSYDQLTTDDQDLIASADLVGVTNWNLNRCGTELACRVFEQAKKQKVKTFFDSGDPSPRRLEIPQVMENVLMNPNLDIFGLNENELRYYSHTPCKTQTEMLSALTSVKKKIPARMDFHTAHFSGSVRDTLIIIPTMSLSTVYRTTGAGDVWNAANIFADLLDFADDERLLFANIVAGYYVSSPEILPPTIDMVINFIKNNL